MLLLNVYKANVIYKGNLKYCCNYKDRYMKAQGMMVGVRGKARIFSASCQKQPKVC